MTSKSTHFTITIRPIPRGISRDDLVANHLLKFGQIKSVRFGEGRGATADVMFVDYFDADSALDAVKELHGTRDPGTSFLKLNVALTKTSEDAIKRASIPKPSTSQSVEKKVAAQAPTRPDQQGRVDGAFKLLRSRESGNTVCVIDFSLLD